MNHLLLLLLAPIAATSNCTRSKIDASEVNVANGLGVSSAIAKATQEIKIAFYDQAKTNPFSDWFFVPKDPTTARMKIRYVFAAFDSGAPVAIKELSAYNTAGKELAHVDYAVQLDKYLSGHYVLLDKDALEKVIVKCKVTVFTENNVLGGDGNGIELFRS